MNFSLANFAPKIFKPTQKNILQLDPSQAFSFFMQHDSYSSINLPPYFRFTPMLHEVRNSITGIDLSKLDIKRFKDSSEVNYAIYSPKGDKYAWRKLQLINPFLYIKIVELITEPNNWNSIQKRFLEFGSNPSIRCMSLPVVRGPRSNKLASQVISWLENVERESIRVSLKYEIMFKTDITNCYSSIYTHSIAWALHTKPVAKQQRSGPLLGNSVDNLLQAMSNGQTNGIPEGSSLMDFVAEIVLGYADSELSLKIAESGIASDAYQIIRYRDDYRIFVHDEAVGEAILRQLAQVLMDLGLRLNASKTARAANLVLESVKPAKLESYARLKPLIKNSSMLRNELLFILDKGQHFPDPGFCKSSLSYLIKHTKWRQIVGNEIEIIAIATNIAFHKPDCFAFVATIISHLDLADSGVRAQVFADIREKISLLPNSGFLEVWLQRIAAPHGLAINYTEDLCEMMTGAPGSNIFPEDWKVGSSLENVGISYDFFDTKVFNRMKVTVSNREVLIFERY